MASCRSKQILLWHSIAFCWVFLFLRQNCWPQSCIACVGPPSPGAILEAQDKRASLANGVPWTIRKRVDEVMVFFTVTNGRTYINDLAQKDIRITDDSKSPARISTFGHLSDLPLRLGLLVDVSDSMQDRFMFEKQAASQFVRNILRPGTDQIFVSKFSREVTQVQDYTGDVEQLAHSISSLSLGGETAMYDAILESCEKLADAEDNESAARVLVVLTDGNDNSSRSSLNQVIEWAQRREVTVYAISTNNAHADTPGDRVLKQLAQETGGRVFFPNSAKDIVRVFNLLEEEMRGRYVVSYQPNTLNLDGRFHHIQIIAERLKKKYHVHARKGYYARLTTESQ